MSDRLRNLTPALSYKEREHASARHKRIPPLLRRGLGGGLVALFMLVALALPVHASYPMRVKDARGKIVTIRAKPARIVSISPNSTEILYALGLGDRVVGVTRFCDYPPEAKKKPKVGDTKTSAEAVVTLKPDLVLAHAFVNDTAIPQLEKLGLTVFAIDPKTIEQITRDIGTIGKITGRPKAAEKVATDMRRKIVAVKKARAGKPRRSVLAVVQSNPLWVAGPKTFVDEMIRLADATNVAFDARPGFVTFSKELAISRSPDVIIVGIPADVDYFLKSPEWRDTNAVKHKRVLVIKSELMTRAGPRLADGLGELAKRLAF